MTEQGYTQIPNDLMDKWLPHLSGAELKVLLYISRRTLGFHRDEVEIGMRKIADGFEGKDSGTGLRLDAIQRAVKNLATFGLLKCTPGPRGRINYVVDFDANPPNDCSENQNSECSENQNSRAIECSENQNSDRSENQNTKKESRKKENHHQKERLKERELPKQKSTVVEGASDREPLPKPEKPPAVFSQKADDDEKPPEVRKRGATDEQELVLRVHERHGKGVDSEKLLAMVRAELLRFSIASLAGFLEFDQKTTTNPKSVSNPPGYYRKLARDFANASRETVRLVKWTHEHPKAIENCPRCGCEKGKGYLLIKGRDYGSALVPCCLDEDAIAVAEKRRKIAPDWRDANPALLVTASEWERARSGAAA